MEMALIGRPPPPQMPPVVKAIVAAAGEACNNADRTVTGLLMLWRPVAVHFYTAWQASIEHMRASILPPGARSSTPAHGFCVLVVSVITWFLMNLLVIVVDKALKFIAICFCGYLCLYVITFLVDLGFGKTKLP